MDIVETATPVLSEIPFANTETIKAVFSTGNIIVIQSGDLKAFAIRAGVVAAYGGLVYWGWKAQVKPAIQEHKERRELKKKAEWRKRAEEARAAAKNAEQATS